MQVYYKHKIENLINIDKIITIHYFEFEKDYVFSGESHDFWEMVYCVKNGIICKKDCGEIQINKGQLLFHKPNERHSIRADGVNPPDVFIISFTTKSQAIHFFENKLITLDKQFEKYIFSIIEESKATFNIPVSDPSIKKMELNDVRPLGGLQIIKNDFESLLIKIMRKQVQEENNAVFLIRENYKGNLSGEIIKYLNEHVNDKITIQDLANHFHYNKSYLFNVFKKQNGRGIIEYFNLLKMEKAKQLLSTTAFSIKDISEQLGFDTPSYFCKVFKDIVKISPLKYRKK